MNWIPSSAALIFWPARIESFCWTKAIWEEKVTLKEERMTRMNLRLFSCLSVRGSLRSALHLANSWVLLLMSSNWRSLAPHIAVTFCALLRIVSPSQLPPFGTETCCDTNIDWVDLSVKSPQNISPFSCCLWKSNGSGSCSNEKLKDPVIWSLLCSTSDICDT